MSWKTFSQPGTQNDSIVVIKKWRVQQMVNELIQCDQLDSVHQITINELNHLQMMLANSESLNEGLKIEINTYKQLINLCNSKTDINNDIVDNYKKLWKKERRQKYIIGGISILEILLIIAILI